MGDIPELLGFRSGTIERPWERIRAWTLRELAGGPPDPAIDPDDREGTPGAAASRGPPIPVASGNGGPPLPAGARPYHDGSARAKLNRRRGDGSRGRAGCRLPADPSGRAARRPLLPSRG